MEAQPQAKGHDVKIRAMTVSVTVGIVLLGAKFLAWALTGSAAVLSDALESIINVAASIFGWYSVRLAAEPPDEDHPYGHGKVEYFSAGFEGGLILLAALGILVTAVRGLIEPPELTSIGLGSLITGGAAAINGLLGVFLVRLGRRSGSMALEADGRHLITDLVTSAGVILALIGVQLTGFLRLDPIVAFLMGLHILGSGWMLVRRSAARLMDQADEPLLARILETLKRERRPGDLVPHQLRARRHGDRLFVDFHLFLPRFWELTRVHARIEELESALESEVEGPLEAVIHVDPCRPLHCSICDLDPCPRRGEALVATENWDIAAVASRGRHPDFGG